MNESNAPRHRPMPIRLGQRHRRWTHSVFVMLWLSGVLWLAFHYFMQTQGTFGPRSHPLEQWWLRLHGLAMMAGLIVLGSLSVHHAPRAWQLGKNQLMGAALTIAFVWLAATGYALYYFSSDANEAWLPLLHWIPGLALPGLLVSHIRRGRIRKRTNRGARPAWDSRTPVTQAENS